jgi:hypothetical protein
VVLRGLWFRAIAARAVPACPVSENYESRMRELYDTYHGEGVAFVAINPNNPSAVRLDELGYTDLTDSPADMKIRVKDKQIPWPYLYDGETQSTVQKFGAVATPHFSSLIRIASCATKGASTTTRTRS